MATQALPPEELDGPLPELAPTASRIGRYRLLFELASGGMGTVYLARAEGPAGLERLVALKRVHAHLAQEPAVVQMFLDEARIASRVNHPNVCPVYDFGEEAGTYFIAMEFLAGESLSAVMKVLRRRQATFGSSADQSTRQRFLCGARLIADACEGLHAAHELRDHRGVRLNVVHRDVSPHNLFITYDGSVRVVDFGIARAADQLHTTETGAVKGKYSYMSPEQVGGKPVDRRTDVWALGVVLWELLSGKRLFSRGTPPETALAVHNADIRLPSCGVGDVPEALEAIAMRALQRDPAERYQSARDMGLALLAYLGEVGDPVGMPQMNAWMDGLFPQGRAGTQALLDRANRARSVPPPAEPEVATRPERVFVRDDTALLPTRRGQPWAWLGVAALVVAGAIWTAWPLVEAPPPVLASPEPVAQKPSIPARTEAASEDVEPAAVTPALPPKTRSKAQRAKRQRRVRPARAKAAVASGSVNIVTTGGWAYIYKNGTQLGATPTRLRLPAGTHELELRPFGREPGRTVKVVVTAGAVTRHVFEVR